MANQTAELENLDQYTVAELRDMADEMNITVPSHATKSEIIAAIEKGPPEKDEQDAAKPATPKSGNAASQQSGTDVSPLFIGPTSWDNVGAEFADLYGSGREFRITLGLLQSQTSPVTIILGALPLGAITQYTRAWVNVPFAGTPTPTCGLQLVTVNMTPPVPAVPTVVNTFGTSFDGTQAALVSTVNQLTSGNVEPVTPAGIVTAFAVVATFTNLATATGGSVSLFARYIAIAPMNPPHAWDPTAVTPRVMPPY